MNTRAQTLPYEHLRRPSQQILEIDEVTTGASLVAVDGNVAYHLMHNTVQAAGPFVVIKMS